MSSNSAETSSPSRSHWSLTARLALLTALSSFVILAAITIYLYSTLASQLKTQNSLYLKDEVETLGELARFPEFGETLADEMHIEPVGEEYVTHYVRLLNREGRRVVETRNMETILPSSMFPQPDKNGRISNEVSVQGKNGSSYIVTAIWINTGIIHQGILQVALDVTNVGKILTEYRTKLAFTLGVGFLLCTTVGFAIARKGTRPLREITEKARQITMASLDERLGGADWPQELHDLAGALNRMLDRLQDSFSRMYNSSANLTHKLLTPLTIIIGQGEVALAQERSAEELREVIASSVEECERISHLVNNILFLSQGEMGKLQYVPIKFMARAEIDKVLDFYGPLAEEKGITVTSEVNATLAADPTLFRQAVAILLSNAFTFTPAGGSVVISVSQGDDGSAAVRITDTGCGIAKEEMEKIFDLFYRVYATRFMDLHGSGLGLLIVRTIMNLHGGTIEIMSEPGQGTTALLTFPQPAPAASRSGVK